MTIDIMGMLRDKARWSPQTIVLPESLEETILCAAREIADRQIGQPVLVGAPQEVLDVAAAFGLGLDGIRIVDNSTEEARAALAEECQTLLPDISVKSAKRKLRSPLNVGAFLVSTGQADAMVAGLLHTTQDVILASMTFIGMQPGIDTPSSLFLMRIPGFQGSEGELVVFSDCAVAVAPDAGELADIAIGAARTVQALLGWEARVALLSFSTRGSGDHESVDRVREALQIVREREPGLTIDGEFQVDTAIVPAVAKRKIADSSPVAGQANILIFPDLNAGNIAYKCVQRFAKADAFGPLLQGFAKSVSDLSRGSSVTDVVGVATMAAVYAQGLKRS